MPLANAILGSVSSLKGHYRTWREEILFYTAVAITISMVAIVYKEQFGYPIKCRIGTSSLPSRDMESIERECLNSYLIINQKNDAYKQNINEQPIKKYGYYRWVVPALVLQFLLITIPLILFNRFVSTSVLALPCLNKEDVTKEDTMKKINIFANYYLWYQQNRLKKHYSFGRKLFFVKLFSVLCPIAAYFILSLFLASENMFWIFDTTEIKALWNLKESILFPTDVLCKYEKETGIKNNLALTKCYLEMNHIIGKFAGYYSLWLLFLSILNICYIICEASKIGSKKARRSFVEEYLDATSVLYSRIEIDAFLEEVFTFDSALVILLMETRFPDAFMVQLMAELFTNFTKMKKGV